MFSARQRIRRWKYASSAFHLLSVGAFVFCLLWALPIVASKSERERTQEWKERQEARQMLFEALDRLVRYEHYFHDIHGRFTRDLARLSLPPRLSSGDLERLRRAYEISVIEVQPGRFLLQAAGLQSADRVTIDESRRLNANFVAPPPTRAYLLEEADRLLNLRSQGLEPQEGIFSGYWQIGRGTEDQGWVALGVKQPVAGERRELQGERVLASIFAAVSERVKSRFGEPVPVAAGEAAEALPEASPEGLFKEVLQPSDVQEWLERARLAQHVHRRERGRYATRWEQFDTVSDFHFAERLKAVRNIRVHPIEISADGREFRLVLEGTSGDLLGEQFVMDSEGSMRQVRYTEALIHQLQEGTNLLENTFHFQINPIVEDGSSGAGRP